MNVLGRIQWNIIKNDNLLQFFLGLVGAAGEFLVCGWRRGNNRRYVASNWESEIHQESG